MKAILGRLRNAAHHFLALAILPGAFCLCAFQGTRDEPKPKNLEWVAANHSDHCNICNYQKKDSDPERLRTTRRQAGMPQALAESQSWRPGLKSAVARD
jgi:hypothetical protein